MSAARPRRLSRPAAGLAALLCCAALPGTALAGPPPVEIFFDNASFNGALISPSGKYIAAVVGGQGQRDRLAVVDLADNKATVVGQFPDADISRFQWVNDKRLILSTGDRRVGQRDMQYGPGLFAVDRDGKAFRQLVKRINNYTEDIYAREVLPWHTSMLDQPGNQDSDDVYVADAHWVNNSIDSSSLLKLNTVTGAWRGVDTVGDSQFWLLDRQGEPRLTGTLQQNLMTIHYRDPATRSWRMLDTFDAYADVPEAYTPLAFGPDQSLYVIGRGPEGKRSDKRALYRYDLATGKMADKPLIALDGFDFLGQLVFSDNKLVGAYTTSDATAMVWFDPALQAMQQEIDKLLPNTINLVSVPLRPETTWVLVLAYSDRQPNRYLAYNRQSRQLTVIGNAAPQIRPDQMAGRELVHYKARDGRDIPAWLTLPPNGKTSKLPMMLLVHDGPFARGGDWAWYSASQFLASRGYAVLEPEYRGSTGYGDAHFRAGWKQWGLAMQDDLADAARWAAARGTADARRICIGGAGYGGYATLMALAKDGDVFRCGVAWAAVTDLTQPYDGGLRYTAGPSASWQRYAVPLLTGDQAADAAQLRATSPLTLAPRIRQPLLLAYGGVDLRVPLKGGIAFRDAVAPVNPGLEWVEYPEEGHGWTLPANRVDFWRRVETFLGKHIGKAD